MNLGNASSVARLADHIEQTGLEIPILADEYRYASLPICVIDAVFSIGVRYSGTQRVVENFCDYTGWTRFATSRGDRDKGDHGVQDLVEVFEKIGVDGMADGVFKNRQRTSTRSGILKSEAVLMFCQALADAGINHFTDLDLDRRQFAEATILGLPGQSSGIAFDYFMMLAGDDNLIKPDRMVQRLVGQALDLSTLPQPRQTALLVRLAAGELRLRGGCWTPLSLDYAIWSHQRAVANIPD